MYNTFFFVATLERALKTFAQTFLALSGADVAGVLSASSIVSLKVAGGAAILSIFTSLASSATGRSGPSLFGETTEADTHVTAAVVVAPPKPKKSAPKPTTVKPVAKKEPETPVKKPAAPRKS